LKNERKRSRRSVDSSLLLDEECGQIPEFRNRMIGTGGGNKIVGGVKTGRGQIPWQLGLYKKNRGKQEVFCGGALVTHRSAITASHCLKKDAIINGEYQYEAWAGRTLSSPDAVDPNEKKFFVVKYFKHPDFDPRTLQNDIAVLSLKPKDGQPLVWTNFVRPICLPEPYPEHDEALYSVGSEAIVSGFGLVDEDDRQMSPELQHVKLNIVDLSDCRQAYESLKAAGARVGRNNFCAAKEGKDACTGDSGGPMVKKGQYREDYKDRFFLIGVVSYGKGCAQKNFPGVYARVDHFIPWIKSTVERIESIQQSFELPQPQQFPQPQQICAAPVTTAPVTCPPPVRCPIQKVCPPPNILPVRTTCPPCRECQRCVKCQRCKPCPRRFQQTSSPQVACSCEFCRQDCPPCKPLQSFLPQQPISQPREVSCPTCKKCPLTCPQCNCPQMQTCPPPVSCPTCETCPSQGKTPFLQSLLLQSLGQTQTWPQTQNCPRQCPTCPPPQTCSLPNRPTTRRPPRTLTTIRLQTRPSRSTPQPRTPAGNSTVIGPVCVGQRQVARCQWGQVIRVTEGFYGRPDESDLCPESPELMLWFQRTMGCDHSEATDVMATRCNNRRVCTVSELFFSNSHCAKRRPYLFMRYVCEIRRWNNN